MGDVVIDDITIGLALPDDLRVRVPEVLDGRNVAEGQEKSGRRRRDVAYKLHRRQGLVLKHVDETNEVILKLSLPRIIGGQPYNFPLHLVRSINDINVTPITRFVQDALGLDALPAPLDRWPVIRWAAAIDVDVGQVGAVPSLEALARVQRDHPGKAQVWKSRNTITGAQWGTKGSPRMMVYRKAAEILETTPKRSRNGQALYGPLQDSRTREREARRMLADQAANILRVEVTLDTAKVVRGLFDWTSPATPTLRLMTQQNVQDRVLGHEVGRLQLFNVADLAEGGGDRPDVVEVLRQVILAIRRFNAGRPEPEHFSLSAAYRLAAFYMTEGLVHRQQVLNWNGGSGRSTLAQMKADLRKIELPPLAGAAGLAEHHWLVRFGRLVRDQLPSIPPKITINEAHAYEHGLAADAPWSDLLRDMEGMRLDKDDDPDSVT